MQDNPSVGTMWMNMGIALYRFDRVEDALACYRMAEEQLLKQYEKLDALPDSTEKRQALEEVVRELNAEELQAAIKKCGDPED